ncbi:zinc ribbon domain-containing protein [Patulibacter sp. SYSU D01012]|uniref:FmdB family zinc ribbon protein n=1 Tax=Patulibacter sp. SYSU D01012 TaxID=2817381 RepID=UPI001B314EAE|nr:zinc ribbon domain-containing protein [Patulibacter sp. SYSU D01012]
MPIYEYRRPDGSTFEVLQKFSDEALTQDPDTGVPVERVLSAPAIHFKGSGFHNTDYGTRKRPAGSGTEGSSDAGSSSASSSDAGSSSSGSSDASSSSSSSGGAASTSSASSGGAKD